MTNEQIHELVRSLLADCFPGDLRPDPFELLDHFQIHLTVRNLGGLKGFYFILQQEPQIVLSDRLDEETARIVCAHELGHHVLHRKFAAKPICGEYDLYLSHTRWEVEANQFAAHLLIPDVLLSEALFTLSSSDTGVCLDELAVECGTTPQLMAVKLGRAERPVVFPDGAREARGR